MLCPAILGASWGTTSPLSVNPATGEPYGPDFPSLTPNDLVRPSPFRSAPLVYCVLTHHLQARCHKLWLEEIGITGKIHAMIGISLGGMQVLQYVMLWPQPADGMMLDHSRAFVCCRFASLFPEGAKNMVVIASTAHTSPVRARAARVLRFRPALTRCCAVTLISQAANALRYIQRHAVVADSKYVRRASRK